MVAHPLEQAATGTAVAIAGGPAIFSVVASGTEPLFYKWRRNGTIVLTDEVSATLAIPDVRSTNAGTYSVTVSNAAGVVTSPLATLTVIEMDFGDAPASYSTALAQNGARHRLVAGIRLGATAEVADIIFFLCSGQASYVTGSEIHINGGQHV